MVATKNPVWQIGSAADPWAGRMADRHYSRKTPGSRLFCPPGYKIVLYIPGERWPWECDALWVWWRGIRADAYTGWWNCSIFRNEHPEFYRSSDLIREAVGIADSIWGLPQYGYDTYVMPSKLRSARPGACYRIAGWQRGGWSKDGKKQRLFLQVTPHDRHTPTHII